MFFPQISTWPLHSFCSFCSGTPHSFLYWIIVQSLSRVWLFCDPMDCSPQTPLPMGSPRQEDWSGFPFSSPGEGLNPHLLHCQAVNHQGSFSLLNRDRITPTSFLLCLITPDIFLFLYLQSACPTRMWVPEGQGFLYALLTSQSLGTWLIMALSEHLLNACEQTSHDRRGAQVGFPFFDSPVGTGNKACPSSSQNCSSFWGWNTGWSLTA